MAKGKGFTSGKTANKVFPGSWIPEAGTYEMTLAGAMLYWNDAFKEEDPPQLQMGFIFQVDDPDCPNEPMEGTESTYEFVENYVRLQVDDDNNFSPGGKRAKAFKVLSALYGKEFDSFSDEFEWNVWSQAFEDLDLESIADVPHIKSYKEGERWLQLDEINIMGTNVIGQKCMIQIGFPERPDGKQSDNLRIVAAIALPSSKRKGSSKSGAAKPKGGKKSGGGKSAKGGTPDEAAPEAPKHVVWTLSKFGELEIPEGHWLPFLRFWTEDPALASVNDMSREDAVKFKGIYDSDVEQVKEMYADWAQQQEFPPDAPAAVTGEDDDDDEDFPPEEDLPF